MKKMIKKLDDISDHECSMIFEDYIHHIMALLHDSFVRFQATISYKQVRKKLIRKKEKFNQFIYDQRESMDILRNQKSFDSIQPPNDALLSISSSLNIKSDAKTSHLTPTPTNLTPTDSETVDKCRVKDCRCTTFVKNTAKWNDGKCKYCNHPEAMHY